ncbi:MAG: hypothetical protein AB8F74_13110 [Saprospiraceae bacterium]
MNPILPSGAFFPKDAAGFLINPCAMELIDQRYAPVLGQIVDNYIQNEGANLHSVYLRGSVPRGMNVGDCDLDTFALVFSESDRWKRPDWADEQEQQLQGKYPFLTAVEFYLAGYAPVLRAVPGHTDSENLATNHGLAMVLKTQSLCLHGNDISSRIPAYKPDVSVLLNNPWLASDIADYESNSKDRAQRQQVLKTILRSGFELVLPRIQQYTPDLYLCYRSFSDFYPKKEKWMRRALLAYLNSEETSSKEAYRIVNKIGPWLVKQFKTQED